MRGWKSECFLVPAFLLWTEQVRLRRRNRILLSSYSVESRTRLKWLSSSSSSSRKIQIFKGVQQRRPCLATATDFVTSGAAEDLEGNPSVWCWGPRCGWNLLKERFLLCLFLPPLQLLLRSHLNAKSEPRLGDFWSHPSKTSLRIYFSSFPSYFFPSFFP